MKLSFLSSLRFRVAAVFLLVSAIPLGVVGLFSVRTSERLIVETVTNQLDNLAADKADLLRRWIAERNADLAVVAGSAAVRSLDPRRIAPYLDLVRRQYRVYHRFIVVDREGRTVYDTAGTPDKESDAPAWHREATAQGTYVSPIAWDDARNEAVFHIAESIRGDDERPIGAVRATVGTQAIVADVLRVSLGETGECYLVDRAGTFLAHKEPWRVLRQNIAQSESFTNLFGERRSGPVYTDYRGIPVLGASRAVAETPWFVVVEQDRDEAFAASALIRRNIQLAMAATVICAMALSWGLAAGVTSPIRALSLAAESLSQGDFQRAIDMAPLRRTDEIGSLDAAFRRMANQLWDRHTRLQQRIGATEDELRKSEDRLKQTLQAAARSEQLAALGRLAAGVAHEIRNPLASLKLFLQSLREDPGLRPDQVEDLAVALRQSRRMEATIQQFLDFARPRDPCPGDVDFAKLVDDALLVVRPRANHQKVVVSQSVASDLPRVQGDGRQLGEAVVNLLVNALEAVPNGGRLAISVLPAASGDRDGPRGVRIEVSDTGPGVPPEDVDRLFEPFFTTKASGSGLGLAIVRQTVERHGGKVSVRNQADAGATFSLFLPASDS